MMLYMIVDEGTSMALTLQVRERIADGWVPLGGVAMNCRRYMDRDNYENFEWRWAQAMTKEDGSR